MRFRKKKSSDLNLSPRSIPVYKITHFGSPHGPSPDLSFPRVSTPCRCEEFWPLGPAPNPDPAPSATASAPFSCPPFAPSTSAVPVLLPLAPAASLDSQALPTYFATVS